MKTLFLIIALLSTLPAFGAGTNAIKNGLLQNDLDAGGHVIRNVTDVQDSNGNTLLGAGPGGGEANDGVNIGTGVGIYAGKSGVHLQIRNIATSGGATASTNANTLTISADAPGAATAATNSFFVTPITNGSPTAVIQAAINGMIGGGVLSIQPGTYTITSPLIITNGINIEGNGANFVYASGQTNFMLDTTTNFGKRLLIEHLVFDGGVMENYNTTNYASMFNGSLEPYYSSFWTNRSGLRVECSGGVRVRYCTFKNWPGSGCLALQVGGTLAAQNAPKFEFLYNRCFTNFIGVFAPGANYETPGYNNTPSSMWLDATPEYGLIEGNDVFNNQRGLIAGAGNLLVLGNTINGNWHGIDIFTGNNPGHGNYSGNTINHNYFAIYTEATSGGLWENNQMLANQQIVFNNTIGITFRNNSLGQTALVATNGSAGVFANNVYQAGAVWGNPSGGSQFPTNLQSGVLFYGNMDTQGTNTDGTMVSILEHGMNPAIVGGFASTPDGSNAVWTLNGSALTSLNASQLSSGTVPIGRFGLSAPASGHTNIMMFKSDGSYIGYDLTSLLGLTGGGSGSVSSIDISLVGHSSDGPLTTAGTLTLTRNADENFLGFGLKNVSSIIITNTLSMTNGTTIDLWYSDGKHLTTNTAPPFNWRFYNTNGVTTGGTNNVTKFTLNPNGDLTLPQVNGGTITAQTGNFSQAIFVGGAAFGVDVSGNVTGLTFTGSGSGLTSLPAANLSGVIPHASLPTFAMTNNSQVIFTTKGINSGGGITNTTLTASTLLAADANKQIASVANGIGVLTNDAGGHLGFTPLLDASALKASQYAATDANTNLVSTQNGNNWTNTIPYTHEGTTTNINIVFNGTTQIFTVTNGPDVWLNWSGANGSAAVQILTNVTVHSSTTFFKFLAGSNGVSTGVYKITNGWFTVTSAGGTNATQLSPAIVENQ